MKPVVIVAARRTPQGRLMGGVSRLSALDLALTACRAALDNTIPYDAIDAVIFGNVLSAGNGMNLARQVGVNLGVPIESPAMTVNTMCASGMSSVFLAAEAVAVGRHRAVLCGGTESMSNAPYLLPRARGGYRLGDGTLVDGMLCDGLTDPFSKTHMGLTAETLAREYRISRLEQDQFALRSQQLYAAAEAAGKFDAELVHAGKLERDEHPRPGTTLETLSELKPAFQPDGTVTAGNASGINDGAAALVVCAAETARTNGWPVLARINAFTTVGCDPARMGLGPVHAVRRLCREAKCAPADFDTVELNEAFAAQALACLRELAFDEARVNPDGGSIALGHPIGATGARLIVHLAHRIARSETRHGLATLCVGAGMGAAISLHGND